MANILLLCNYQVLDNPKFWGTDGYFLSKTIFGANKSHIPFTIGGFIKWVIYATNDLNTISSHLILYVSLK